MSDQASATLYAAPREPPGSPGPAGPEGRPAAADILFARVNSNAQLLAGRGVVSVARVDDPTFENYGVTFDRDIRNCTWSVSLLSGSAPSAAGLTVVSGTINTIRVDEGDIPDGGQGFHLLVFCCCDPQRRIAGPSGRFDLPSAQRDRCPLGPVKLEVALDEAAQGAIGNPVDVPAGEPGRSMVAIGRRRFHAVQRSVAAGGVWGAQTRSGSRGRAVFVNEPTETIPSADAERMGRSNSGLSTTSPSTPAVRRPALRSVTRRTLFQRRGRSAVRSEWRLITATPTTS